MNERPIRPDPKPEPRKSADRAFDRTRPARLTPDQATDIAIQALSWLAADAERLDRFLSLTGIDHEGIRKAAQEPGFLSAVLDHLCADEDSLLTFVGEVNLRPEMISGAREILAGPSEWPSI